MAKELPNKNSERGVTLLSVIIAVTVVLVTVAAITVFLGNMLKQQSVLQATSGASEVEIALQKALAAQMRASPCLTASTAFSATPIGTFSTMDYTKSINLNIKPSDSQDNLGKIQAAAGRCRQPRKAAATNNWGNYFCLKFNGPGTVGSLFQSANAFAEVYADTRDLQSDTPVDCQTVGGGGLKSGGSRLYYTIYWTIDTSTGTVAKQRSSMFVIGI